MEQYSDTSANIDYKITGFDKIYNPTFYLPIPNEFNYEGLILTGSMNDKTPYIGFVNNKGNKLLKVKFYGDAESSTGYFGVVEDGDIELKLKVNQYARRGTYNSERTMYVDLSEHLKEFGKDKPIKFEERYANNFIDLEDNDSGKTVRVRQNTFKNVLKYTILQGLRFVAGASVSKAGSHNEVTELNVRSGEDFDVNIDLYNGLGNITNFAMYIPVAREGKNGWEWSAQLKNAGIDDTGNISISYSTDKNPSKNGLYGTQDPAGVYVPVSMITDMSSVTMVKLSASSISDNTLISLKATVSNLIEKTELDDQKIEVKGEYYYLHDGKPTSGDTNLVTVYLRDTTVQGTLFEDSNENGILNIGEKLLQDKQIRLRDKDGNEVQVFNVKGEAINEIKSDKNGLYQFKVPALHKGYYLEVEKMDGYALTWQQKEGNNPWEVSYFDRNSYQAEPNLKNVDYLNAGFVKTPEIKLDPKEYKIRMGYNGKIKYTIADGSTREVKFKSSDTKVVTVDENGVLHPVSPGKTQVEVYYETASSIKISAIADVTVETNNPPVITVPPVVTMNVGDFWEPLNPNIIDGLGLSDDHDEVSYLNLDVDDESVPREGKFLFFFRTKNTDRLTKAGTYKVTYSYTDNDNNYVSKDMILKVNGQPKLEYKDGTELNEANIPSYYYYFRVGTSLNPMEDVKAYYDKASDTVGEEAVKTEILPGNNTDGSIFSLKNPIDSSGNEVVGSPDKAGKYQGTYYIKTGSEAKNPAVLELDRTLYAQGKINFSANSIVHSGTDLTHKYDSWKDFYDKFKDELDIKANVESPLENGTPTKIDLTDTIEVLDPDTDKLLNFSELDFSLAENQDYKTIRLRLKVTDAGKAAWATGGDSVYGEYVAYQDIDVTVQQVKGDGAPKITFKDIERIESDEIRDVTKSDDKDLSTDENMADAAAKGQHPLLDRLMNDVEFTDETTPPDEIEKKITEITRISRGSDPLEKIDYRPDSEEDIRAMMKTVGEYRVTYQAIDEDSNVTFAERAIKVAGETRFVSEIGSDGNKDVPAEKVLKIIQSNVPYEPAGIVAYHMHYDEVSVHITTPTVDKDSVDISNAGTQEIEYTTRHHFDNYPGSSEVRPLATFTQRIEVNGKVTFNQTDNNVKSNFVNDAADLKEVQAFYKKASETVGADPIDKEVNVSHDQTTDSLTSAKPDSINVEFTADASSDSGITNHKSTLNQTYDFYGLPEIKAVGDIKFTDNEANLNVRENMTKDDFEKEYPAKAKITLPDNSTQDLTNKINADYTHMNDGTDPHITLSVTYTLDGATSKTDTKTIHLNKVKAPVITTSQDVYSYNVGDAFDLLISTELKVTYKDHVDLGDVDIKYGTNMGNLPLRDGKLTTAGTYKVIYSYTDSVGNTGMKEILVKVNGLPEIEGTADMVKRVGDNFQIWDNIKVKWLKAPDAEGSAVENEYTYSTADKENAILTLRNMKDEIDKKEVDFGSLNTPGYYSGEFYARTPAGGETTVTHTLLLHGKPVLTANNIVISKSVVETDAFLTQFKEALNINASVERASKDSKVEKEDLNKYVVVNSDESDKIEFGTPGIYKVVLEVTDPVSVDGSKNNTVTHDITVQIAEIAKPEQMPVIETPVRHRVVGDPIGMNSSGEENIGSYLAEQPIITPKDGNPIIETKLKSLKKKPSIGETEFKNITISSNDELKKALNAVGEYIAEIEILDKNTNVFTVKQEWQIAGATEFGTTDSNGEFKKLNNNAELQVRQSDNPYQPSIRARHQDPDGSWHYVGEDLSNPLQISNVGVQSQLLSASHHYMFYEDDKDSFRPRPQDKFNYTLLIQGKINIEIEGESDIYTRINSDPDLLKGVKATYNRVDKEGNIYYGEEATLTAGTYDNSNVGKYTVTITATDDKTKAMPKEASITRDVYVHSVPALSFNENISISSGATVLQLQNALAVTAKFKDHNNNEMQLDGSSIKYDFSNIVKDEVVDAKPGQSYDVTITLTYDDSDGPNTIKRTAHVYVLNDPDAIVDIPAYIELKNKGSDEAEAQVEVKLHKEDDMDQNKDNVPAVNVTVDDTIELTDGSDSKVKVMTLTKDGIEYDGTNPIMTLKYSDNRLADYFYLKAKRKDFTNKALYQGTLNFYIGYEGDQYGKK